MGEIAVNILEPKLAPAMVLAQGGDYSSYSRRYDLAVEKAFTEAAHKQQRDVEAARLAAINAAYERQRQEEMNWSPVQIGLSLRCGSCGGDIFIPSGAGRDGTDETDPREPHAFRDVTEGQLVLTTPCTHCSKSLAVILGKLAPSAPRHLPSISTLTKRFGTVSGESSPTSREIDRKFSWRQRLESI
jgi:hypothetical protein